MTLTRPLARHRVAVALVAGMLLGVALTAGGVAVARIPDSRTGVITACRSTSGSVRIIDTQARQRCRRGEAAVKWNSTGPRGPQGATGPAGPTLPVVKRTAQVGLESTVTTTRTMSAEVPQGDYVAAFTMTVSASSNARVTCELLGAGPPNNVQRVSGPGEMTATLPYTSPGGVQTLARCYISSSSNTAATATVDALVLFTPTPGFR